jgi:hypothetical protein
VLQRWVIPTTGVALLLLCGAVLVLGAASEKSILQTIRITAVSSLFLFSAAFSASALVTLFGRERWQFLLASRRRLGLAFALSHTFHLLGIVLLVVLVFEGDLSKLGDLGGGAVIYGFIYLMAATSNDRSVRWLGAKNWKRLHKVGAYLVFIGLFSSYLSSAVEKGGIHYWVYSALGLALLSLRITAFWKTRRALHA